MNRREFVAGGLASLAMGEMGKLGAASLQNDSFIRAVFLGMGRNMWGSWRAPGEPRTDGMRYANEKIDFSETNWRAAIDRAVARNYNMVVIDLGEFVRYPSVPELAVEGSWSPERLRSELSRLRNRGLEPIPKLNFSATHDAWLKEYSRMHATRPYYDVCKRLIQDVAEIFDRPRFLHIGYDEERWEHQQPKPVVAFRQGEAWWHDFLWFVRTVEGQSMRPWIWSDYGWHHSEFVARCPKSVMQSNWYYDDDCTGFDEKDPKNHFKCVLDLFVDLDRAGFDQIPCGSNWVSDYRKEHRLANKESMGALVDFCRAHIAPERLKGFFMAPWAGLSTDKGLTHNCEGIDVLADKLDGV